MANLHPNAYQLESVIPEHGDQWELFDQDSQNNAPIKYVSQIRGDLIARYTGVIVEAWDHKNYGRGKRAYLATFDEKERAALANLYKRAYGWCMRTGHPDYIQMRVTTFDLLVRAANFFATI